MIEIYTLKATRGEQLTGPYSRLKWNHPGPSYFYLLAPLYLLMNNNSFGLLITAILINIAAIILILTILEKYTDLRVFSISSIILAFYLCTITSQLISFWSPRVTYLPFMGLVYLCALVALNKKWALPFMFFIGSFIIQTNLMYVPTVAILIATALTVNLISNLKKKKNIFKDAKLWWVASLLILLVMWTPPLIEEINNSPGNMSKIGNFFLEESPVHRKVVPSKAFGNYIRRYGYTFMTVVENYDYFGLGGIIKTRNTFALSFYVLIIAASIISSFIALKRENKFFSLLLLMYLIATAISTWSVFQIVRRVRNHLVFWTSTLSIIALTAIIGVFLSRKNINLRERKLKFRNSQKIKIFTVIILLAISSLTAFKIFSLHQSRFITEKLYDYTNITEAVIRYIEEENLKCPVLTVVEGEAYKFASMIFLNLYKKNVKFLVKGLRSYIFQGTLKPTGKEKDYIVIAASKSYSLLRERKGYHFIARNKELCLFGCTRKKGLPKLLSNQ